MLENRSAMVSHCDETTERAVCASYISYRGYTSDTKGYTNTSPHPPWHYTPAWLGGVRCHYTLNITTNFMYRMAAKVHEPESEFLQDK
jgi:hypothetical protein